MNKHCLRMLCLVTCVTAAANAALLGTYDFTSGETSVPTAPHITFGAFARRNVTANSLSGGHRSASWNTGGSIDTAEYVQFTLTPESGYQLTFQSLSLRYDSSTQLGGLVAGPDDLQVRLFSGILAPGSGNGNTPLASQSITGIQGTAGTFPFDPADQSTSSGFTVRVYGWNAAGFLGSSGTLSFDDVAVSGVVVVPEPTNMALLVFGCMAGGSWIGCRLKFRRTQ